MPLLTNDALSMLPRRVIDNHAAVLCQTTERCLPAAPDPATAIIILNDKKSEDEPSKILNEERKQVTAHTNLTQIVSTIDCVRYFDIGKRKEGEMMLVCSDLQRTTSAGKEISESKEASKNRKRASKKPKRKITFTSLSQKSLSQKRL